MNSIKLEVQWSPVHSNKFITWGTEVCLYEIAEIKDVIKPSCKLNVFLFFLLFKLGFLICIVSTF